MNKGLGLALLLSCYGVFGCGGRPPNVVGTWVISDESRHRLLSAAQQKAAAKIVLERDGTFIASEIPDDLLYGPPQAGQGLVTGTGTWKQVSGGDQVQLEFKTIAGNQPSRVPYGTQLNVSKSKSVVNLFYFQGGDADQGRRIEFAKQ